MHVILQEPLYLNNETQYALNQLEKAHHPIFVSGKAGTGKSTLLQLFRNTSQLRMAIVAPTGVAALNVKGQTIHSFFRLAPRILTESDISKVPNNRIYKNLELLIIDEISMVRADLLDAMDIFLRKNRGSPQAFGGVRLVIFGDLFQLPPVLSGQFEKAYIQQHYDTPYFFSSHAFSRIARDLEYIELKTVHRQKEAFFISILDQVRHNCLSEEGLSALNERVVPHIDGLEGVITLTTRNDIVDRMNAQKLASLNSPSQGYTAVVNGTFDPRAYPTDTLLSLKVGAQIMTLKNDIEKRYVNGSIGRVMALHKDAVDIMIYRHHEEPVTLTVHKESWEMIKYQWDAEKSLLSADVIGSFEQIPVKLAWAATIHKSQGKTFDQVYVDMGGGAFEYGQTYVALSRCTHLEGIYLKRPLRQNDILLDPRVTEFYDSI